ncbi:uncharacterized protein IL334_004630 [Kwoniella shivajii]|uniref:Transcriptional coactivator HFI1/ADA1 n=1 Tax=Kwoniella shivajii TaxID=564305 RepID=A0ABZ1D0W0_9TREE|nr:hypothetical protein IL334_004630 [Kwoniella shivajii]
MSSIPPPSPHIQHSSLNHASSSNSHRPPPVSQHLPFERIDTHSIKQQLHDSLGEDGLPYWKALNGYLLGQIGRGELEAMVRSWLKGDKLELHNTLLLSLLNNASIPPTLYTPMTPASAKKRKRVSYDNPEFDIDDEQVEPKSRVQTWIMGMGGRERARVRRAIFGKATANGEEEEVDDEIVGKKLGAWSTYSPSSLIPPIAIPSRHLPSSHQLSLRLSQYAQTHSLSLAQDTSDEIGDFLAVGLDTHVEDILHGIVHLTGRDRPGIGTVRIPKGTVNEVTLPSIDHRSHSSLGLNGIDRNIGVGHDPKGGPDLPKPDLQTLHHLLLLNQSLQPQVSPAIYKLMNGQTFHEQYTTTPLRSQSQSDPIPSSISQKNRRDTSRIGTANGMTKVKMNGEVKSDLVMNELMESGLLKLDKAGRQSEIDGGDGKKEKKHNLHWKYEDPAVILKDILG